MALLIFSAVEANASFIDSKGQSFQFSGPVKKIITLAPHLTELVYAAGAGERIVATIDYSDYPPAANKIPRIGNSAQIDFEAVISQKPDLVLAWQSGNATLDLARLEGFSIPVFYTDAKLLNDIPRLIRLIGEMAHTESVAEASAQQFQQTYRELVQTYSHLPKLGVYYQIWNSPRMSINGQHMISDIIRLCGGYNVFDELSSLVPRLNIEAVIAADPQVIVTGGVEANEGSQLEEWYAWKSLRAVKHNLLFSIPADLLHRHTPRILQGAALMCGYLAQARRVYYQ